VKVVYDENMPAVEHYLGHCCELTAVNGRTLTADRLRTADVLLVRSVTPVNAELLAGSGLSFVGSATSGLDHVDRRLLQERGIRFQHAPGANANSVVEYVLAAIASVDDMLEKLLAGARLGIVGYGHVGQQLAARCSALGIDWSACDPWLPVGAIPMPATLDEVLRCDVVCLHPALTRREPWPSYHLLEERALDGLHDGQLLINASRGPVVDNRALLQRLSGRDAPKAVLDVWESEPHVDAELLRRTRLGTAHIAGYSLDAKINATRQLAEAMKQLFDLPVPAAVPASLDAAPLVLDATCPADTVRGLLAQRYAIEDDDRRLREVVLNSDAPEAGFDRLRKHYPERREVAGSRLQFAANARSMLRWAEALGAVPDEMED
jgi:erythronate-4-phosphate dehydrogenase